MAKNFRRKKKLRIGKLTRTWYMAVKLGATSASGWAPPRRINGFTE